MRATAGGRSRDEVLDLEPIRVEDLAPQLDEIVVHAVGVNSVAQGAELRRMGHVDVTEGARRDRLSLARLVPAESISRTPPLHFGALTGRQSRAGSCAPNARDVRPPGSRHICKVPVISYDVIDL